MPDSRPETPAPPDGGDARHATLLRFFKALADASRLRIVGVLAQRPSSVEELADALDLDPSTVSHHLKRLAAADLVDARAEGRYSVYRLRLEALHATARDLLGDEALPALAGDLQRDPDLDDFERKVLATFTDADGRFTAFPAQRKKYLVLVRHALQALEPGERYSEAELNARLERFHPDTARLRRSFVDEGLMGRERDGSAYWVLEG